MKQQDTATTMEGRGGGQNDGDDDDFIVMCGRGRGNWNYPGNHRQRELIRQYMGRYRDAATKVSKTKVVKLIISKLKYEGYRFVMRDPSTGKLVEQSEQESQKKVAHSIRDYINAAAAAATAAKATATASNRGTTSRRRRSRIPRDIVEGTTDESIVNDTKRPARTTSLSSSMTKVPSMAERRPSMTASSSIAVAQESHQQVPFEDRKPSPVAIGDPDNMYNPFQRQQQQQHAISHSHLQSSASTVYYEDSSRLTVLAASQGAYSGSSMFQHTTTGQEDQKHDFQQLHPLAAAAVGSATAADQSIQTQARNQRLPLPTAQLPPPTFRHDHHLHQQVQGQEQPYDHLRIFDPFHHASASGMGLLDQQHQHYQRPPQHSTMAIMGSADPRHDPLSTAAAAAASATATSAATAAGDQEFDSDDSLFHASTTVFDHEPLRLFPPHHRPPSR